MSAYIVDDAHIDAILSYANLRSRDLHFYPHVPYSFDDTDDLTKVGMVLKAANFASVNHRYNENDEPDEPYTFRFFRMITPVEAYKACRCLDYQSCERDDWAGSEAQRLIEGIERQAVRDMANQLGYDNCKGWSFNEEERGNPGIPLTSLIRKSQKRRVA